MRLSNFTKLLQAIADDQGLLLIDWHNQPMKLALADDLRQYDKALAVLADHEIEVMAAGSTTDVARIVAEHPELIEVDQFVNLNVMEGDLFDTFFAYPGETDD